MQLDENGKILVLKKTEDPNPLISYTFDESEQKFTLEKEATVLDCSTKEIAEFFEGKLNAWLSTDLSHNSDTFLHKNVEPTNFKKYQ